MIEIEYYLSECEILAVLRKYNIHRASIHEEKVKAISIEMFDVVSKTYFLNNSDKQLLKASAYLHDIGYFINKAEHHKHSSYLILNDKLLDPIPAFIRRELALICENHRKIEPYNLEGLSLNRKLDLLNLIAILRLADALSSKQVKHIHFENLNGEIELQLQLQDDVTTSYLNKLASKSVLSKQLFNLHIHYLQ
jgi:exopolyphosphatase/pppGpp-phosphohydrolase